MNKYFIITALGLASGFFGEEIGMKSINLLPKQYLFSDSILVPLFLLAVSFVPFITISAILIFRMHGYASYAKGVIFSIAYYLPFQYKAIWGNLKQPNILISETFGARLLVILAGALFLSSVYYVFIRVQAKVKRKVGT